MSRYPILLRNRKTVIDLRLLVVALVLVTTSLTQLALASETDPAVLAILESSPQSPAEKIQAAKVLINLHRYDLAKEYLQQVIGQQLSTGGWASLHDRFGSALFMRMANDSELQPSGAKLSHLVMEAARKMTRDLQHIKKSINELTSENEETRFHAMAKLQRAGSAAVAPLLAVLTDSQLAASHQVTGRAMLALGPAAVDPLVAVLAANNPLIRLKAIQLLGQLQDQRAVTHLIGPAFSSSENPDVQKTARIALGHIVGVEPQLWEAEHVLQHEIKQFQSKQLPWTVDLNHQVSRWRWQQEDASLIVEHVDVDIARARVMVQLTEALSLIRPHRDQYQLQSLSAQLAVAKLETGIHRPLPTKVIRWALDHDIAMLEAVLQQSLRHAQPAQAIAALEVLETCGTSGLLTSSPLKRHPIVRALDDPHRRVRFAAAKTIMQIDPHASYPGSSRFVTTLLHLGLSTGERRALIGFPRLERGSEIAGLLEELGYTTDLVTDSKEFFRLATQSADYDLAFLSDTTRWPNVHQLLQSLRLDHRSADLPVAVMDHWGKQKAVERITAQDPLAIAIIEPFSLESMKLHVHNLIEGQGRRYVPPGERLQHAKLAMSWLVRLAENKERYGFYEILSWESQLERALYVPALSLDVTRLFGLLGSPTAQRALIAMVNEHALPIEQRQAAAHAFQQAVDRRGILLRTNEIVAQYSRYNASRNLAKETQDVLASVLDILESHRLRGKT